MKTIIRRVFFIVGDVVLYGREQPFPQRSKVKPFTLVSYPRCHGAGMLPFSALWLISAFLSKKERNVSMS